MLNKDIASGGALALFGAWLVWHAGTTYSLGTAASIGPGAWPSILGGLLILFGVVIAGTALVRPGVPLVVEWRSMFAVLGSIAAFALIVRPFGLVPAICALVLVSLLASPRPSPKAMALLCIVLSAIAALVFRVLLGINITLFSWTL